MSLIGGGTWREGSAERMVREGLLALNDLNGVRGQLEQKLSYVTYLIERVFCLIKRCNRRCRSAFTLFCIFTSRTLSHALAASLSCLECRPDAPRLQVQSPGQGTYRDRPGNT